MEIQSVTASKKSNAAWICGLIGFITSLPNSLCAMLCAATVTAAEGFSAGISVGLADDGSFNDAAAAAAADAAMNETASQASILLVAVLIVSIVCFALSFLGKSKNSLITGIFLILGALFILINGFIGFGSMLWGTATGGLYLASGLVSILNQKKA